MKNIIKIALLMTLTMMFLAACQSNSKITNPISEQQDVNDQYQIVSEYAMVPDVESHFTLHNDRNVDAGYIYVYNDQSSIYVRYYMNEGWQLDQSCLQISGSIFDIPVDRQGMPNIGAFCNKVDQDRGIVYSQKIPFAQLGYHMGDYVVIVSQADVSRIGEDGKVAGNDVLWAGNLSGPGSQWWQYLTYRLHLDPKGIENIGRIKSSDLPEGNNNL